MARQQLVIVTLPTLDQLTGRILQLLPRELRDMIWAYTVQQDEPINIANCIVQLKTSNTTVLAELREAAYTHNTLIITFPDPRQGNSLSSIWGAHPEYRRHIQSLVVEVRELSGCPTDLLTWERENASSLTLLRKYWNGLLSLPRLESLTINMQKISTKSFGWPLFTPILYQLRSSLPKLHLTFNISYDNLLRNRWENGDIVFDEEYNPMGYVDITALFERPSQEDKQYVEQHYQGRRDVVGRDAINGSLLCDQEDRRALATQRLLKDPELTRVKIEEHYEIFKRVEMEAIKGALH
jgi:hypothetical protein